MADANCQLAFFENPDKEFHFYKNFMLIWVYDCFLVKLPFIISMRNSSFLIYEKKYRPFYTSVEERFYFII